MRVLRLTPFFHHPDTRSWPPEYDALGGMQIQIWRQAMWLATHGVSQHVLTMGFPGLPPCYELHPELRVERAYLPLPEIRSELTGLWGLTQSWAAATLLKMRRIARQSTFDIVHVHLDGQIPALIVACLAPVLLRLPAILTVHCSRLAVYRPMSKWDLVVHRFARRLECKALVSASAVIALTPHTASVIQPAARHIEVMPDIVDPQQFHRPDECDVDAFRQRYRIGGQTVGFIGRIAHEKGWKHFVAAAQRLQHRGFGFLVVGDGPQRKKLEKAIADARLSAQFVVTGFLPNSAMPAALAACDVVVIPSEHEEFGGTVIEALSVGTQVAAFAVGGIKETLANITPELLAEPRNVDQLADRILLALSRARSTAHAQWQKTARTQALAFSPDQILPRLVDLYHHVAKIRPLCSATTAAMTQPPGGL